tara:strand:- start:16 stop:174 length:159 start_codon:yes stop_codon:yes gene_type:complete
MNLSDTRKFLFRCKECKTILSVDLEEEDFEKVQNNEIELECPCGNQCVILRD